jgi:hypothetical protein
VAKWECDAPSTQSRTGEFKERVIGIEVENDPQPLRFVHFDSSMSIDQFMAFVIVLHRTCHDSECEYQMPITISVLQRKV